jgi:hypothetical protein
LETFIDNIPGIDQSTFNYALEKEIPEPLRLRLLYRCSKITSDSISLALTQHIPEEIVMLMLDKCETISCKTLDKAFKQTLSDELLKKLIDRCSPTEALSFMITSRKLQFFDYTLNKCENLPFEFSIKAIKAKLDADFVLKIKKKIYSDSCILL